MALCGLIGVLNHVSRTPSRGPVKRTPSEAGDMNEVRGLPVHSGARAVDRKRSWTRWCRLDNAADEIMRCWDSGANHRRQSDLVYRAAVLITQTKWS